MTKVILLKELVDYAGNDDMRMELCLFTAKLNRKYLSRFDISPLRKYMMDRGAWHNCFLRLELDYELKPSAAQVKVMEQFESAETYEDYMAAYATEQAVRNAGGYVENLEIEVTGCRFTVEDANEDYKYLSEDDRKVAREYFTTIGYPEEATTPEEVCRFIERLRQDVPEIDNIVKIV